MKLHELHIGQDRACFVGDGHAVASGYAGVGGFAIDLAEAAGGEKNREGADFLRRAVVFVEEAYANGAAIFENQASGEGVRTKMEMRDFVRAGEKSTGDFASRGIAVRVEDPRAAVRGFTREGKFGAGTIEFGAPFDELINVRRAFFDEKRHGLRAADTVSGVERVLFMETDFVFVAECHGDAALRPGGGGVTEIGFGEDEDAAGAAELNGGAQTSDA